MRSRLESVTFDADDPVRLAHFWAALLDRRVAHDARGELLAGSDTQVGLRFVAATTPVVDPDVLHLHLTSTSPADQAATVQRALGLGATHLDVGQRAEEGHVVLADPEGHALCVIEPGNGFLAGCGLLGEVACGGSRAVGTFWAAVLGWPLVWDEGGETAVQSPCGGTKIAWDGEPGEPDLGRDRQRFDLVIDGGDLAVEVRRLLALGAVRTGHADAGSVELADPGGHAFSLTRG